jgi:hypothetical protein
MMKKSIILLTVALLVLGLAAIHFALKTDGKLTLENHANETISIAEVEVCGQKFEVHEVAPGGSTEINYYVKSDSGYKVHVEFIPDKQLTQEVGYVTNGFHADDTLVVSHDTMKLRQRLSTQ